jgi:hypothetical protein
MMAESQPGDNHAAWFPLTQPTLVLEIACLCGRRRHAGSHHGHTYVPPDADPICPWGCV